MRRALLLTVLGVGFAAGCGGDGDPAADSVPRAEATRTPAPSATPPPRKPARRRTRPLPDRLSCPDDVPGCRSVRGRVIYVERVDPDGDGDLHVVISGGGITLPGLTAVDVRPGLRPRRDPRAGDGVAAAGPVQRGSFGQSQIHALAFRMRRR